MRVSYRGVEQLVARRAHNPKVGGSSPPPATLIGKSPAFRFFCWLSLCMRGFAGRKRSDERRRADVADKCDKKVKKRCKIIFKTFSNLRIKIYLCNAFWCAERRIVTELRRLD